MTAFSGSPLDFTPCSPLSSPGLLTLLLNIPVFSCIVCILVTHGLFCSSAIENFSCLLYSCSLKEESKNYILSFLNWLLVRTKDFESVMTLGEPVTP